MNAIVQREDRVALGAEAGAEGVSFEVWAPDAGSVEVVLADSARKHSLRGKRDGCFGALVKGVGPGALYQFMVDGEGPYPDPRSRFQPHGPHGPSMVVDPDAYAWRDSRWRGIGLKGQVICECHIGALTAEGTFDGAIRVLDRLKDVGYTAVEIMPVAEFPGEFNWGYDGVGLYAPYHGYGGPDAFKRFVDAAHALGLAVILDVVYNHLGAEGNYLARFSKDYFTDRYANEWGEAINFDGANSAAVRAFFIGNACYWVREFHVDGLRLDATQSMHDSSEVHVIRELTQRAKRATDRGIVIFAENEPQRAEQMLPVSQGGFGLDAMWNDDFHHCARVALTGRHDGYFQDYRGSPQEFVSSVRHGFLFQGQHYGWQKQRRGSPVTTQPAQSFVIFLQNHDQVANTLHGERLHRLVSPARYRSLTALLLLAPQTPLLFMGQEFDATSPFPFFADQDDSLRAAVHAGRRKFVAQFESYATPEAQASVLAPGERDTFRLAKLDWSEREANARAVSLHRDLISLRKSDLVIAAQDVSRIDGAVLSDGAWLIRWNDEDLGSRLLLVNLGRDRSGQPAPEPLLAPPAGQRWVLCWCSEEIRYGGLGVRPPQDDRGWNMAGECAYFLRSEANRA